MSKEHVINLLIAICIAFLTIASILFVELTVTKEELDFHRKRLESLIELADKDYDRDRTKTKQLEFELWKSGWLIGLTKCSEGPKSLKDVEDLFTKDSIWYTKKIGPTR